MIGFVLTFQREGSLFVLVTQYLITNLLFCGVPQESVLGPMSFLIYINNFNNCAPDIDFHRYADDSNLFCSHKSLQCVETILNDQLCNVNECLCANKLFLNTEKSNFVVFHPPQKRPTFCIDYENLWQSNYGIK